MSTVFTLEHPLLPPPQQASSHPTKGIRDSQPVDLPPRIGRSLAEMGLLVSRWSHQV